MPWILLLLAGLVEVAWSQSIAPTDGFTKPLPTAVSIAVGALSVFLLSRAMRDLPAGTAYAMFTGIGTVGAITLGVLIKHEQLNAGKAVALALIIAGLVTARLTTAE